MEKKRKSPFQHNNWVSSCFTENATSPIKNALKRPPKKLLKVGSVQNARKHKLSWPELYAPNEVEDLAVHKKKVEELSKCLHEAVNNNTEFPKIVLLTGPAGCGKTASLRVLAKSMQCFVREWITPVTYVPDKEMSYEFQTSQTEEFRKFLLETGCKPSLLKAERGKTLILVEDIPNVFILDPEVFHELICDYCLKSTVPVFFVCSDESEASKIPLFRRLFPQHIQDLILLTHISFNPVAVTLMQKALKQVAMLADLHVSSEDISRICSDSAGDIRNAVLMLQFKFDKSINKDTKTTRRGKGKDKGEKKECSLESRHCGPDSHIGLFQNIGRVIYAKRDPDTHKLVHNPHEIVHSFAYEAQRFVGFLFYNYINMFSDCSDVMSASDSISVADISLSQYQQEKNLDGKIGLTVAVLGTMNANRHPIKKYQTLKLAKERELTQESNERKAETKLLFKDSLRCMDELQLLDYIGFQKYAKEFHQQSSNVPCRKPGMGEDSDSEEDDFIIEDVESSDSDEDFFCNMDSALLDASLQRNK